MPTTYFSMATVLLPLLSVTACGPAGASSPDVEAEPPDDVLTDAGAAELDPSAPGRGDDAGVGMPPTSPSAEGVDDEASRHAAAFPPDWDRQLDCQAANVAVGAGHSCVITRGAHLLCWGMNYYHQLGFEGGAERCGPDDGPCSSRPMPVPGLTGVTGVSMATVHTCSMHDDGAVRCWGSNAGGVLGVEIDGWCTHDHPDGPPTRTPCTATPTRVPEIVHAVDIDGWGRTCIAERDGAVRCWGWEGIHVPTLVAGVEDARAVEDGCARGGDGRITCWNNQLVAWPIAWEGEAKQLTKGYSEACVVDPDGLLHCWSLCPRDTRDPETREACLPTPVPQAGVVAEASGTLIHTWLRTANGEVRSLSYEGEVGEALALPAPATALSAGYNGACAVLEDGRLFCWANRMEHEDTTHYGVAPTGQVTELRLCED